MWRRSKPTWGLGALGEVDHSPSRAQIEALARVHIPPSAGELRARLQQVLTKRTLHLRFSLDPSELEAALRASPLGERLSLPSVPALLTAKERPDWFAPARARHFSAAETAGAAILVDTTEPSRWVVYIVASD
jgi:hypothetical protein